MVKKGHDGDAMPHGMGQPMMELPLGEIDMGALAPTLLMMQNLPAVASFAESLASFILATDQTDELVQWMYKTMCEKHRGELAVERVEDLIKEHRGLLRMYLETLGMDEGCSHEKGH